MPTLADSTLYVRLSTGRDLTVTRPVGGKCHCGRPATLLLVLAASGPYAEHASWQCLRHALRSTEYSDLIHRGVEVFDAIDGHPLTGQFVGPAALAVR